MSRADSRNRYREIALVLARYGFEWLWSEWGIGKILGSLDRRHDRHPDGTSQAVRVRLAIEGLGTTFIKVGQMLSTRTDLLPAEYVSELAKLQDQAPAVPFTEIAASIESEFGARPNELFESFDEKPRAAGSIAQVHDAVVGGQRVIVKVRRPGVERQVEQDLAILGQIARFLANSTELGKRFDLEALVDEFAFALRNELDLVREGQNAERIGSQFADDPCLHTPAIHWDTSCHAILTMEEISGIKIDDLAALDAAGIDRKALAERCAHIALVQVLEHGFFHADPHPGNFFVYPDGTIGLIDFGMVGRLDDRMREALVRLALAVSRNDADRLIDEVMAMGAARTPVNRLELKRDLERLLNRYEGLALGDISAAAVFRDIAATAQRHRLKLPSDLVMVVRVIAMDEGLGVKLDPEFNLITFAQPAFLRFWKQAHSVKAISRRLRDGVIDLADIGVDLPKRLLRIVGLVERGELTVTTRIEDQRAMFRHFERAANRIAVSVLTASVIIGLSYLAVAIQPGESGAFAFVLVRAMLIAAIACGAWLLAAFWRSTR